MSTPQDISICGICRENKSLPSYCIDCPQHLCEECHKMHQSEIKSHSVLPKAESMCPAHYKYYATYCKACETPICMECLTGSHNGHKYMTIKQAKEEKMHVVENYEKELQTNLCPLYKDSEYQAMTQLTDYESEIDSVKKAIDEKRSVLNTMIDGLCDAMIGSVQTTLEAHESQVKNELEEIVKRKKEIGDEITKCEELSGKGILEIKAFLDTLPHLSESLAIPPDLSKPIPSRFFPADISEKCLKQMIGTILQINVHSDFSCKLPVSNVQACSTNNVWLTFQDEKLLTKYSYKQDRGCAVEVENLKLQFKPECFIYMKGDCLLASDRFNHCIWKVDNKRKTQIFIKTSPNNPKGLCLNNKQELVVCLSGLTGSLRIYYGEKYQNYREIADQLLNAPNRVVQNGDENYIVLDDHLQTHFVIAIDTRGNSQWKFPGIPGSRAPFLPRSVCCDSLKHIILSDFGNNSVLLLDKDGNFLMNLLSDRYGLQSPRGVCLDSEGKLWVGQGEDEKGKCHIVQYMK